MTAGGNFGRRSRLISVALAMVALGAACSWALLSVLRPAVEPREPAVSTYVSVVRGVISESVSLNAVAAWPEILAGINQASGIVTSIGIEPGEEVAPGATLFTVALRPVVIAQGEVPMFRQIADGAVGDDVGQLQVMLTELGHYRDVIDARVGPRTTAAIRRWQGELGVEKTGVVELGDLVFVPHLPSRIALNPEFIHRGASLTGGEEAVFSLPPAPVFRIPATEAQALIMPSGTTVEVTSPSGRVWRGVAGEQTRSAEDDSISVFVAGQGGSSLCADACGEVPAGEERTLLSRIVLVPEVEGLLVPSSSLVTTAEGETAVIGVDGERITVKVTASAKGMSVISGVPEGRRVRVPAGSSP